MRKQLTAEAFEQAAHCLKVLGHPHRLQILQALIHKQHTVGELAALCDIASNVTSEHLRLMERCGFLKRTRQAREVFYQVCEPHIEQILVCVEKRFSQKEIRT